MYLYSKMCIWNYSIRHNAQDCLESLKQCIKTLLVLRLQQKVYFDC